MKKVIRIFFFFFIFLLFSSNVCCKSNRFVKVEFVSCVDGDTANFLLNGEKIKFRFLAIDTPESVKENTPVQPFGKEASEFTCEKLTNAKEIFIEYDKKSDKTDKYERNLGWIWVDGELLEQDLIRNGLASVSYVYDDYLYIENLCYVQSKAMNDKVGIWSLEDAEEGYCSKVDYSKSYEVPSLDNSLISENVSKYIFITILVIYVIYLLTKKK